VIYHEYLLDLAARSAGVKGGRRPAQRTLDAGRVELMRGHNDVGPAPGRNLIAPLLLKPPAYGQLAVSNSSIRSLAASTSEFEVIFSKAGSVATVTRS